MVNFVWINGKRRIFYPDAWPPDFKPDWRRWLSL